MTYTEINNEILDTPYEKGGLDGFELLVYIYFLSKADTDETISIDIISKHYGLGSIEIEEAFKSLIDRGMLEKEVCFDEKGNEKVYYNVSYELILAEVEDDICSGEGVLVLSMDAPAPNCNNTPTKKDS